MGLKLKLHRRARADLQSIRDYLLANASPQAADRVRAHLQARIAKIGKNPSIGTPTSEPRLRISPPAKYPYRIYYAVTDAAVIILHIRHTSRQLPDLGDLV